ncbi:crossover junction endodeoxyribonuclease RuvC [Thermaerobacillus caldiproteolyticus]|uniref:crossover junction endodeoxyribonuclease RuvC n=1 Tax=Thermaerobacillus caldiproteolyticus TaxID=247480 RepID=UPI0018F16333|nr:crossover junction endodeoxyribonuclease RuvC [Anoxybacillus caldiproteolyticus]
MRFVGIDPSTKTGLVILENNEIHTAIEITSQEKRDPHRFMDIAKKVRKYITEHDVICIEGFSYNSKGSAVSVQYGIGWILRSELIRAGLNYHDVPPSSVKKFATGKGNVKKDEMVLPIYKRWGFEHSSDNVRDAFVLAQMARALCEQGELTKFQQEALNKIS